MQIINANRREFLNTLGAVPLAATSPRSDLSVEGYISAAVACVLAAWTGSDRFGYSVSFGAGTSKIDRG